MDATTADRLIRHAAFARHLARAIVGDDALAEDAVQETWLAAVRTPPRTLSAAWIGAVARNAALRLRRGESRRAAREAAVASGVEASALWRPEEQAVLREVVDAVLALDEPFRSTVLMRFYEDLPPREIAARQGAPVSTVNSRLQRGLAELRRRLGAERDEGRIGALLLLAGGRRGGAGEVAARAAEGALMGAKVKAAVACAAALLFGAVAWHVASPGNESVHSGVVPSGAVPDGSQRSATAQRPRTRSDAGRPGPAVDEAAATTAEPAAAKPDLTGVVTVPEGVLVTVGSVWASGAQDGKREILTRVAPRADGTFDLFVGDDHAGAQEVEVGASAPGCIARAERVALKRGSATRVELRLERGAAIKGTVVDAAGVPVPGLRILARSSSGVRAVVDDALLDTDALVRGPFDANVHWAWATTDASGRFVADGLGPGTYEFFAESPAWILATETLVSAGAADVRLVARPAFPVVLRVRDAKTGEAVKCRADLTFRRKTEGFGSASSNTFEVPCGELRVRWDRELGVEQSVPAPEGKPAGVVRASVTLRADGYHAREIPIALDAEGARLLEAELDPVVDETLGRLRLEVVDARGELVDFGIDASLYDHSPEHAAPTSSRLSKEKAGTYLLSVSPGRWTLRVGPDGYTVGDIDARRDVEIVAGGSADLRVVLPASGIVVVRRRARDSAYPEIYVSCEDTTGNSSATTTTERELRWRVPPGALKVDVGEGDAVRAREVSVRAFEETLVEIDD